MQLSRKICLRTTALSVLLPLMAAPCVLSQANPSISLPGSQSPFLGSEPEGKVTAEVLQIDFKEAIDRGLRNNLGGLLAADQTLTARGERWKELSELLPNIEGRL